MEQFDYLIQNGTILTMQSREQVLKGACLGITGDRISYVGHSNDLPTTVAKRVVDAKGGLVLPGLVNGHTHAAMTLFRGLADDLPLMEWLTNYIFPVEKRMDTAFVKTGALLACAEMILSGTTTFCDMYLFEEEIAEAAKEAGMRCLVGEVLYDFPSPNYGAIEKGFEYTERMIRRWKDDPLVSIAVEPHAVFTCSPELLLKAQRMARTFQVPMIIHVAETLDEVRQVSGKYGKRPFEHLDSLGLLGPQLIAIHCIHLSPGEIRLVAEKGVKVVTAPESNMKLASGICPVPRLRSEGVVVGLGTDGCASNNNLDLFGEMDSLAKIHKVDSMDPTAMDAYTVLSMATLEGARALGMDGVTGSLAKGKKADVIIVDTCKPHLTPMFDPYSQLVYAAKATDVSHTFINGRLVLEERRLLTMDVEEIMKRAREKAKDVAAWVL
jgi:5-methylthioadenosine/S-adenosylhomocysteine deaminase